MSRAVHVRLAAHPANPARFHQRIDCTLTHDAEGGLQVDYAIHGLHLDLRVPTPHAPAPADALWRTTCCELFVGPAGQSDYREFNFSPSGQWAVYDFLDYRERKPGSPDCHNSPVLQFQRAADLLKLTARLPHPALPSIGRHGTLRIALSAVLEANDGSLGYWALAHAAGKPDFHRAGFMLCLGPDGLRPARCA